MIQFHNDTINTMPVQWVLLPIISFNSTTVQLIRYYEAGLKPALAKFQFHNGTINTAGGAVGNGQGTRFNSTTVQLIHLLIRKFTLLLSMFQFHNGTINTNKISKRKYSNRSFNSTTVQLILCILNITFATLQCFNSTTVQLILSKNNSGSTGTKMFQFHNGTINTPGFRAYYPMFCVSIPQRYN